MREMLLLTRRNVPSAAATRLYEAAFPLCERRLAAAHASLAAREPQFHACELYRAGGEEFVGILYFWHWPEHELLFVEHLAISPEWRGQGVGRAALELVKARCRCVILEIEPVVDAATAGRLAFYRASGFRRLAAEHVQLPYHEGWDPVPMELLSYCESGAEASPEQVALLEQLLREQVMGMQNAECKMQNAECRMQNAKCRMQNAECRVKNHWDTCEGVGLYEKT